MGPVAISKLEAKMGALYLYYSRTLIIQTHPGAEKFPVLYITEFVRISEVNKLGIE